MSKIFKCPGLELGELTCLKRSKRALSDLRAEPLPELAEIKQELIQGVRGEVLVESFSVKMLVIMSVSEVG